ncbi:MAG TPA: hypothetical protein VMI73_11335 [Trebonia sp.]|nr:hypothetical protein [Trebonia sp.]
MSGAAFLLVLPEALFEFSIGSWLTVKGFRPSPITAADREFTMPRTGR